jgi:hypothetical protein
VGKKKEKRYAVTIMPIPRQGFTPVKKELPTTQTLLAVSIQKVNRGIK